MCTIRKYIQETMGRNYQLTSSEDNPESSLKYSKSEDQHVGLLLSNGTEASERLHIGLDQWDIISFIYFQGRAQIKLDNPLALLWEAT